MKFTVDRDEFSTKLALITCVRGSRWAGLTVSGDDLHIRAGDSKIYVSTTIPIDDADDGTVLVDGKLLSTCVATLVDGSVTVATTKARLRIQQNDRRRYIQTGDPDLIPIEPKIGNQVEVTYPIKELLESMRAVKFALGDASKGRVVLSGYYFSAKDGMIFTADNIRLASISLPGPLSESILVPSLCETALANMAKIGDSDVTLRCTPPGWIELCTESTTMRVATIGGTYPIEGIRNVRTLLDAPGGAVFTVERRRLLPLLRMATELGKQTMLMLSINPNEQTVTFRMDVSGAGMDDTLTEVTCLGQSPVLVGLHSSYFNQAVQAIPGDIVNVLAYSEHQPVVIQDDDLTVIQMVMGSVDVAKEYQRLQEQKNDDDF